MYKCEDCGCIFSTPKRVEEDRGEFWGMPAYEAMYYCPRCGSDAFHDLREEDEE